MITKINESGHGPVNTSNSHFAKFQTFNLNQIQITDGFWKKRILTNREISLPYAYKMLELSGNFNNMRIAAGLMEGEFRGFVFLDSDIYKWIEAAAWESGTEKNDSLSQMITEAIDLIALTQQPDGYINSYVQSSKDVLPWSDLENGHELYCAGHLFQAAIAMKNALNDDRLLTIACKFADHICDIFGPQKKQGTGGHQIVEMAFIELYRLTGTKRYLELAHFFIFQRGKNEMRGHPSYGPEYHQDHLPFLETSEAVGHAVRQLYYAAGITDLYIETGEAAILNQMKKLSDDIVMYKQYITGGIGSRFDGEAFGDPYELPSDQCYCETCAAIANFMWNWRMLIATGESRYANQMERILFNNILSSPALDGTHFFYMNPLLLRDAKYLRLSANLPPINGYCHTERPQWHDCACCPPNVMRILASLPTYLATQNADGIQIHHYATSTIEKSMGDDQNIKMKIATDYPWRGDITIEIDETISEPWNLMLRIPEWNRAFNLSINDVEIQKPAINDGYIQVHQKFSVGDVIEVSFQMEAAFIFSNPRVDAIRDCVAIQRGPIVYCIEDHDQEIHGNLMDMQLDEQKSLNALWEEDLLGGIMVIEGMGHVPLHSTWENHLYRAAGDIGEDTYQTVSIKAIPYYSWGNRQIKSMRVWIPRKR